MKVFTKGIFLEIQNNHRICCFHTFSAIFFQLVVLFEGFYIHCAVEFCSDIPEEYASSVFRITDEC
jgi:hypothetical protein